MLESVPETNPVQSHEGRVTRSLKPPELLMEFKHMTYWLRCLIWKQKFTNSSAF